MNCVYHQIYFLPPGYVFSYIGLIKCRNEGGKRSNSTSPPLNKGAGDRTKPVWSKMVFELLSDCRGFQNSPLSALRDWGILAFLEVLIDRPQTDSLQRDWINTCFSSIDLGSWGKGSILFDSNFLKSATYTWSMVKIACNNLSPCAYAIYFCISPWESIKGMFMLGKLPACLWL